MRALRPLLPLALFAAAAPAGELPPVIPLSGADSAALLGRLQREGGGMVAIRAAFTQTTESPLLAKPETSRGTLLFRRAPLAFRYQYDDGRVFALESGRLTYWLPASRQAGRLDLRRFESRIARFADPLALTDRIGRDYELTEAVRWGTQLRLELRPVAKQKRSPIAAIVLRFTDPGPSAPLALEGFSVKMKSGDRLEFSFTAVERNPPLQADAFSVKIPAGIPVRESLPDGVAF